MASWLIRIDSSSGKSRGRRRAIYSGLHARAPPPRLPAPVPAPLPRHHRPRNHRAAWRHDHAGQPLLHVLPQLGIDRELRRLGPAPGAIRMPLRRRRSVREAAGTRGGVATQLPGNRRRRPRHPAGNLAHSMPLNTPECDLLSIGERQIPPRQRRRRRHKVRRWHAACLPKPPCPARRRYPGANRRVLTRASRRDRRPEPAPLLMPSNRGSAWRA